MYQLTPQEEAFYKQMWSQLDPNGNGFAEGKDTVQFFKKSRLPVQQLKAVWVTAVRNEEGKLFYHEFTTAMRLIAYCQNGFEMSEALLHETRLVPLPVMDGFPVQAPTAQQNPSYYQTQPVQSSQVQQISLQQFVEPKNNLYELPPDLYGKYETCFRQQDKGNQGFIPSDPAKAFFQKSGLPLPTLMNLWELVDEGRKGYLSKNEFIVAVHLIALCRKDIPLPQFLPDSLIQIMKRDSQDQVRPTSQTVQPITSQMPPQRVSSQNELQGLNQAVSTLQNRVQNQSQQIQLANNLDAQKQIIEEKKKDIEFLNQTIQKLQSFYNYLKNEQDELAAQLSSLNGQCAQKQQQMSGLQDCIQNQLQVNQGLQKQIFELKSGQENQPPQAAFQTIHLDDDYDYSGYRAKKEKLGSGGNNEILPWH